MLGTAVSGLAIPTVAIVSLRAEPFAVGVLATVQFAAFPLLGLVAGVWVDRWSRRATMLVADIVRAVALATIPVAAFAHVLGFAQLVAVAACVGIASVFFEIAYQSLVPSIVAPDELERANARLEFTNSAAQIAGNGIAGALIAAIGAPLAIVVDAASYVVSVLTLVAVRVRETHRDRRREAAPGERASFGAELREGVAVVLASPAILRIGGATATFNLGIAISLAVFLLYLYRVLHLSPAVAGVLLAVSNVGFAGALFAPRIARRLGAGRTLIASASIPALALFLVPLAVRFPPLPLLFLSEIAATACIPVYNITQVSLRQRLIPADKLGRVNATLRTVVWGTMPVGTLLGGALAGTIGIVPTLVVAATVASCAIPWLLTAPVRTLRAEPAAPLGDAA
ncbi:MAG: Major facilitator superfamily permease [Candidatus Eremiobacteraeota bacterium]|nr:Major facilitator superfamily permease [Candidatus Eremiobacteraeota bacterium]